MPHSDNSQAVARLGRWLHRHFLLALMAVYVLSGIAPGPGIALREFEVALPGGGVERISMLLLAVLLFCAAAVIDWEQAREVFQRPSTLVIGLACAWLGPALLVLALGPLMSRAALGHASIGVMAGLALVAAMPVANSSAGWTQNAGGNVAVSLGLVVLSVILSPLVTPALLKLMGWSLNDADTHRIERVVSQFSGSSFILWVILPSLAGAACAWLAGQARIAAAKPAFRLVSLATILVLNYANASLAIEKVWRTEEPNVILVAALLAALVSVVGMALAALQTRLFRLPGAVRTALLFGLSMKHTGLALVLAGAFLADEPRVILVVLLTTLAQHLAAGIVDRQLQKEGVRGQESGVAS